MPTTARSWPGWLALVDTRACSSASGATAARSHSQPILAGVGAKGRPHTPRPRRASAARPRRHCHPLRSGTACGRHSSPHRGAIKVESQAEAARRSKPWRLCGAARGAERRRPWPVGRQESGTTGGGGGAEGGPGAGRRRGGGGRAAARFEPRPKGKLGPSAALGRAR